VNEAKPESIMTENGTMLTKGDSSVFHRERMEDISPVSIPMMTHWSIASGAIRERSSTGAIFKSPEKKEGREKVDREEDEWRC
jgi:hypothetical protein